MANILSHRIVGPIFAIKRSLEMITRGSYEEARLKLREGDKFHDVSQLVNQVVDQVKR